MKRIVNMSSFEKSSKNKQITCKKNKNRKYQ